MDLCSGYEYHSSAASRMVYRAAQDGNQAEKKKGDRDYYLSRTTILTINFSQRSQS